MHLHILFFLIQASQAVDLKVKAENQAVDERNTQVDQGENWYPLQSATKGIVSF